MTVKEFNLMEHQEETFERMAFEAGEERDLLKYVFIHHFEPCDVCVHRKNDCDDECDFCNECKCPCKNCWIGGADENFVLDAELIKSEIRKGEENEQKHHPGQERGSLLSLSREGSSA